jgi:flagellar biosynthesis chaperone FliJ
MESLPSPTEQSAVSKFLARPEGKFGLIPPILLGAALFYFWAQIVPFVLAALTDTLHAVIVGAVLAAILFVLFDENFRRLLFYIYRSVMRMITGWFINLDPIGIQKTFLGRFKAKLDELDTALGSVRGLWTAMGRKYTENKKERDISFSRADAAQRSGNTRVLGLESKQVDRLDQVLKREETSLSRLEFIIKVLSSYREVCADQVTDIGRDIKVREDEQKEANAFRKGMAAARAILKGMPDQEYYDESTAVLEARYTSAIGEVEQFMDVTKDILANSQIDGQAATEMMNRKLEEWRNKNAGVSLGKTSKQEIISQAGGAVITLPPQQVAVPIANFSPSDDEYRSLFNK